ncbi:TlpA disulfide reductase family protein [Tessaracoccus sp. OH4464_COT-324]|uniref:TlpA family protein disulfide reductase n=1 Tax=Tessaracoccus sp. OH4464_COT-324 TaxID=2491059 RepID=UPI000F62FC11|nr:TlpA disulfide reductase family protein [Tessaracoccus sp. OH4464_COT-324]RRD47200.1 TlpA family protein disulfide reductase [Tessaracoccus sp. OH4464_COT-324]
MMAGKKFPVAGVVALVLLVAGALLVGRWVVGDHAPASNVVSVAGAQPAPKVGQPAPPFSAPTLDGAPALRAGKPVWLVFMASWCQQCRVEAPDIQEAAELGEVNVVAVYLGEDEEKVRDYAKRVGLTFAAIPDPEQKLAAAYGVRSIPTHYFIDASGTVRDVAFGALGKKDIAARLDGLLGKR